MKKILFLLFFVSVIMYAQFVGVKEGKDLEKKEYKKLDKVVSDSFQFGCEAAIMRSCDPKQIDTCRKYCFEFIQKNPQMLKILKKKARVLIEEYSDK